MEKIKIKKSYLITFIIVALLVVAGAYYFNMGKNKTVILETNMGNITIELDSDMPVTAGNFEKLVNEGFYDGVIFHRVIAGFMIQGGDPTGTGRGGP